jgi:CHASE2 domain-containing sensor protein
MRVALPKIFRQPGVVSIGVALAVFVVVAGLRVLGFLQPIELAAYDTYLQLRPEHGWRDPRITVRGKKGRESLPPGVFTSC